MEGRTYLSLGVVFHHQPDAQLHEVHEERLREMIDNEAGGEVGEEAPLLQLVLYHRKLLAAILRPKLAAHC